MSSHAQGATAPRFIVDHNVGRLAKWLRIMGYDAVLFTDRDDGRMLNIALSEGRIILTRDRQVMVRHAVTSGKVKALLIRDDRLDRQLRQVVIDLALRDAQPFTRCIECNALLVRASATRLKDRVPPYVYATQDKYKECPRCHRIYWRGTHLQAMARALDELRRADTRSQGISAS